MSILSFKGWRWRRIQMMRQTEVGECALASLGMVANYHGHHVDLQELRRRFQASTRGSTLRSLIRMAETMGFKTRALSIPLDSLSELNLPAILHWDMKHFVVVERVRSKGALIHDPEGFSRWLSIEEISRHFTGIALELRATGLSDPVPRRPKIDLFEVVRGISGIKKSLAKILVLSLCLEAYALISPFYLRFSIDYVLPSHGMGLMAVLFTGFALLTFTNAITSLIRSFAIAFSNSIVGHELHSNIARKLLRLPVDWYERRHIGDIVSRIQSINPIRQFLTENTVGAFIDGFLGIFSIVIMLIYSPILSSIAIVSLFIFLAWKLAFLSPRRCAQEASIVMSSREQSIMIETLRGITTLRVLNGEENRLGYWERRINDSFESSLKLARINVWQDTVSTCITSIEVIISTYVAIGLVVSGGLSLGMVFAYMAYKTQFLRRSASLVDQIVSFRMLRLHLDRLSDIVLSDDDRAFDNNIGAPRILLGRIELINISYRYSPEDPYVISGINLIVEPGEHIAITGPSGQGKSTLIKIILGIIEPSDGYILVDGISLDQFGLKNYRDRVGAVLQNDGIFAGSLADNISLFDQVRDFDRVVASAQAAALHDEITDMPMGYETLVGDMGAALSGGQKQRLMLARALYRKPDLLVVDEGTSHLDEDKESRVNAAISAMGITRIVVAHRQQTILSADRVVTVSGGNLY